MSDPLTPSTNNTLGEQLSKTGCIGLYISLAIIYIWFGGMKFTAYEAQGLVPLVSNSPLIGWMYGVFSEQGFSIFLGILEMLIAALILGRCISPKLSVIGGALSCGLFITTLTMMATTPGVFEPNLGFPAITVAPGQFLLKDIGLLAASIFIVGESLNARTRHVL